MIISIHIKEYHFEIEVPINFDANNVNFSINDITSTNTKGVFSTGMKPVNGIRAEYIVDFNQIPWKENTYYAITDVSVFQHNQMEVSQKKVFLGEKDFLLEVFKVQNGNIIYGENVNQELYKIREQQFNKMNEPVIIENGNIEYEILIFIKDVLLSSGYNFNHIQVIPTDNIIESDITNYVNSFFSKKSKDFKPFIVSDEQRKHPTILLYMANIVCESQDRAFEYAESVARDFILTFASTRGSYGEVVATIIRSKKDNQTNLLTKSFSYRGNLATGGLSGEKYEIFENRLHLIQTYPLYKYYLQLLNEAKKETNINFALLKYWSIVEAISDGHEYSYITLTSYNGNAILSDDGKPILLKKKTDARILQLLIDLEIDKCEGINDSNYYKLLGTWLAFRNATAHYGGFDENNTIQQNKFRDFQKCKDYITDKRIEELINESKHLLELILMKITYNLNVK